MSNTFSSEIFAEKLSKLNNSQQSIETLSHWCLDYQKKAKQIVETWENLFNSSSIEQRVSFLYLANDILQNSRRKGNEFVSEFWKVLPGALKSVCEAGDDRRKNAVMRLVGIWDERKVFGSRGRGLKDDILGKIPLLPPLAGNSEKSSNIIKVLRKDAHSVRIKLTIGGMPEKIVTSYQSVLNEHFNEDTALNKCKDAVSNVGKIEKDVDYACTQGIEQVSTLMNEVEEQEAILKQCLEQLASAEATRAVLVAQLKEALQEQESKIELIHTQSQVAQAETERAISMKQRLVSAMISVRPGPSSSATITSLPARTTLVPETSPSQQTSDISPPLPLQPLFSIGLTAASSSSLPPPQPSPPVQPPRPRVSSMNSFSAPPHQPSQSMANFSSTEVQNKRTAAIVAAKLTASTCSVQMLSSVLSSLAAEEAEAASKSNAFNGSPHVHPLDKRPKLEEPMSVPDLSKAFLRHLQPPKMASLLRAPAQASRKPLPQTNQPPPPPPLPPLPPPPMQPYLQSMPYGFVGSAPQPPLPPMAPPQQQQHYPPMMGFFPPPRFGFYGHIQTAPSALPPGGSIAGKGSST